MYSTSAWSKVQAIDAATGKLLWQYDPKVPGERGVKACCDTVNRGVAVLEGPRLRRHARRAAGRARCGDRRGSRGRS